MCSALRDTVRRAGRYHDAAGACGNAAAKKKIKVNSRTGKITIRKGLKKGKYTIYMKVQVKGDSIYKPLKKTVRFRVTVK